MDVHHSLGAIPCRILLCFGDPVKTWFCLLLYLNGQHVEPGEKTRSMYGPYTLAECIEFNAAVSELMPGRVLSVDGIPVDAHWCTERD